MPKRLIKDIIEGRPPVTIDRKASVRAGCKLMAERRIGALLVMENNLIAGIFTERDVITKVIPGGLDLDKTAIEYVMVPKPQTIRGDRPLGHALYMMSIGGFRHVPVVDAQGKALGMVSSRDAIGQEILDLEQEMKHQRELEAAIGY